MNNIRGCESAYFGCGSVIEDVHESACSRESAGRGHESVIRGHGFVANAVKGLE